MRNKSKIEKLELGKVIKSDRFWSAGMIIEKINELIDAYNSQAQPEESNFVHTVGTPILESTTTYSQDTPEVFKEFSDKNIRDDIPEGFVEINGKLHKMEDTPEEWEDRLTTGSLGESEYFRIDGEYVDDKETMVRFIKQLLDEREREVRKQERMIRLHKRVSKKIDNLEEPYKSFAKLGAGII